MLMEIPRALAVRTLPRVLMHVSTSTSPSEKMEVVLDAMTTVSVRSRSSVRDVHSNRCW